MADAKIIAVQNADPKSQPAEYAAQEFARLAEQLLCDRGVHDVLRGLLNATLTVAYREGVSAQELERLLRFYTAHTEYSFEVMRRHEASKGLPI